MTIEAPWTKEQVDALNRYQADGRLHPFTCPGDNPECELNGRDLVATEHGWTCRCGKYTQNWAHKFMLKNPTRTLDELKERGILPTMDSYELMDLMRGGDDKPS